MNRHQPKPLRLFEYGAIIGLENEEPWEEFAWGYALTGPAMGFAYAKSVLTSVLQELQLPWSIEAAKRPYYIPGRAATIRIDGHYAGHLGEIHPRLLEKAGIEDPVCGGEVLVRRL